MAKKPTKIKPTDPKTVEDARAEDEAFELIRKKMAEQQSKAWLKDEYYDLDDKDHGRKSR